MLGWAEELAGKSFYVRIHRRGFRGALSSQTEERFLDELILAKTSEVGAPAKATFSDPDYVMDIETVGERAGLSLWSREELRRYPFLRIE